MIPIGLVLTLVSVSLAVEVPGIVNSTHCVYLPGSRQISCQYFEQTVECSAVANFTVFGSQPYYLFGIERLRDVYSDGNVSSYQYYLYPRAFDNSTYLASSYNSQNLFLYYGENFSFYGIRVLDAQCFQRIYGLFNKVVDYYNVVVGGVQVPLIGEVLIRDEVVQKRWLFGYGFGYGYPYYGWGGLGGLYGFGYPYYWWGK